MFRVLYERNQRLWAVPQKCFFFMPGGEPHAAIDPSLTRDRNITIDLRFRSAEEFLLMIWAAHAIKESKPAFLSIFLPYVPGGRQDRPESGIAFSLKLFADMINAVGFDQVYILDPHSYTTTALIKNCSIIDHWQSVANAIAASVLGDDLPNLTGIIAPDAGASRRCHQFANRYPKALQVYQATKNRNPQTGAISGFRCEQLPGGHHLVVDDICDGGGTFIGLADHLKEEQPGIQLSLFTTFGIYSKGIKALEQRFLKIMCTDALESKYTGSVNYIGVDQLLLEAASVPPHHVVSYGEEQK